MIEARDVSKHYGKTVAVDTLSFSLEKGETLALIGTSGCGKTTTMRMINRLTEPSSGEIRIEGKNILDFSPQELRRRMGYVIQDIGLFPHYTVKENIAIVPSLLKWEEDHIEERVQRLMEKLRLPYAEYAHKYPDQLSGGQQQRVGIARALAANPPIILMDEPFGALDPVTRREIRREFRELEELAFKTTVIVTHDVEEAFEMADKVILLDKGKVQQLGTPEDLLFRPENDFVEKFLEGQKMQLELELLTLEELFPQLPNSSAVPSKAAIQLEPQASVYSAMSHFTQEKTTATLAEVTLNDQTRYFSLPELMGAYHQKIVAE